MATKEEVIAKIRSYNDAVEVGDGTFTVNWRFDDGRSQIVALAVLGPFLIHMSPFAEKDSITAERAVSLAEIFGVCDMGQFYGLRNVLLIEDLSWIEMANMTMFIAIRADQIESEVGGDRF